MASDITRFTQTSIDLGDDLLEKTAVTSHDNLSRNETTAPEPLPIESPEDGLASAKILMGEGLLEDAKRVLHRVLVLDASNARAKRMLADVHDKELQQIFSDSPKRKGILDDLRLNRRTWIDERPSEQILNELDRDLGLGLLDELESGKQASEWAGALDRDLSDIDSKSRIDVAIAFLEMGLFETASRVLSVVMAEPGSIGFTASCLYATAKIAEKDGFSATLALEPVVSDPEIATVDKIEVFYLLGRAAELSSNRTLAAQWYGEVMRVDTDYRDVVERLNRFR